MTASTAPTTIVAPARVDSRTVGLVLGVASALAFSSSGPAIKPLLEAGWSLTSVLTIRMGVAGFLLSPALVLAVRRHPTVLRRNWQLIVVFGLTGVAGCQLFFFAALQRMPVAVALLVQYLAPVLLVLLSWARTRRAPSARVATGSVLAVVGLLLVVDIAGARFDVIGTLLALLAALCAAAYFVLADRGAGDLPPLALASAGLITGTATMAVLGVTGILPFAIGAATVQMAGALLPWFVPLGWTAAIATTLGFAFGVLAVPRAGSRVASFVGLSEVLFALGFAWLLLGETPAPMQFLGGALIVTGVVLVRMDAAAASAARGEAATLPAAPSP